MAVALPYALYDALAASNRVALQPNVKSTKAAGQGMICGVWIRFLDAASYPNGRHCNIFSRGGGLTGGSDGYLRYSPSSGDLNFVLKQDGDKGLVSLPIGAPGGRRLFVGAAITAGATKIFAYDLDAATLSTAVAADGGAAHATAIGGLWDDLFSAAATANLYQLVAEVQDAFMLLGEVPEVSGSADDAFLSDIGSGTHRVSDIAGFMTSPVQSFWYKMLNAQDTTGAFPDNDAIWLGQNPDKNIQVLNTRPVIPRNGITPGLFRGVCQMDSAGSANVPAPGGTYANITPAAIETRLLRRDGTVYVDWTVTDSSPASGAYAAGAIPGVAWTPGLLNIEQRAVDGAGAEINFTRIGAGWTGVGHILTPHAQSQFDQWTVTGAGRSLPATSCVVATRVEDAETIDYHVGSVNTEAYGITRGFREWALELDKIHPGAPVQLVDCMQSGRAVEEFAPGGQHVGRWQRAADYHGITPPYTYGAFGHSSSADSNYQTHEDDIRTVVLSTLGEPLLTLCAEVTRYANSGTDGSHTQSNFSRVGLRRYYESLKVAGKPTHWCGGFHHVETVIEDPDYTGTDTNGAHASDRDRGAGRTGTQIAMGFLDAYGFGDQKICGFLSAARDGDDVVLTVGPIPRTPLDGSTPAPAPDPSDPAGATYYAMGATGPYYADPAGGVPANTTAIDFSARIYIPATLSSLNGSFYLLSQASQGVEFLFNLTAGGVWDLRCTKIEDGDGLAIYTETAGVPIIGGLNYDTWYDLAISIDMLGTSAAEQFSASADDGTGPVVGNPGFTTPPADGSEFFQTGRQFVINSRWTISGTLPEGIRFEREELRFTTGGVDSQRKLVTPATANDATDGWKGGGDATFG